MKIGLNLFYTKICQRGRLLGICIGCIVAKTNIHVCVVGTNVPTWFRHLCEILDKIFQNPGTVQCVGVLACLYARLILFKETIFPYLIEQTTCISLQNQLWNIPKAVFIF